MQAMQLLDQARVRQIAGTRYVLPSSNRGVTGRPLRGACQAVGQSALTELRQLIRGLESELKIVKPTEKISRVVASKEDTPVEGLGEPSKSAPKHVPQATTPRNLVFVTSEVITMPYKHVCACGGRACSPMVVEQHLDPTRHPRSTA